MPRKSQTIVGLFCAIALATIGSAVTAHAGPLDLFPPTGVEAPTATSPTAVRTAAAGKFTTTGTVATTITLSAACPNSVAATACSPSSNCDELTISGPVTATTLGKSNLSACITIGNSAISSNLGICFSGLGTGTITSASGKNSVMLAMSGLLCIADAFPLPTPTTEVFEISGAYAVESGTGSFSASPSGAGSVSISAIGPVVSSSFAGSGQASFTGTIAK